MFTSLLTGCLNPAPDPFLAVNQTGYRSFGSKTAYHVHHRSEQYELVRIGTGSVVATFPPERTLEPDLATGDRLTVIDFGSFDTPGEYKLRSTGPKPIHSEPFTISPDPYRDALSTILKSYYYHRCGIRVADDTQWTYDACHLQDAVRYNQRGQRLDVTGGWHDAGDYNKFSVNTALSAALLLYAYEQNTALESDWQPRIPVSGSCSSTMSNPWVGPS